MTGPQLAAGWITSDQAAELAGITPASFRKEANRSPELRAARAYLGPLACYQLEAFQAWLTNRPGKGNRTARQA